MRLKLTLKVYNILSAHNNVNETSRVDSYLPSVVLEVLCFFFFFFIIGLIF